ncbi:MAG: hypothetical protein KJ063_02535 [Anaerolineae bacterium]|nr:hypothetical protein [Anaerolineae bacterium]
MNGFSLPLPPPAPDLTAGEMLVGAVVMGLIVFIVVAWVGEMVMSVSKRLGAAIVLVSLPAGGLFALAAWVIMLTG